MGKLRQEKPGEEAVPGVYLPCVLDGPLPELGWRGFVSEGR